MVYRSRAVARLGPFSAASFWRRATRRVLALVVAAAWLAVAGCNPARPSSEPTPTPGRAAPTATTGPPSVRIIWAEAAAAEGEVRVYADLSPREAEGLARLFRRRHPTVQVRWSRGLDRELRDRVLAEGPTDPSGWDVFVGDLGTLLKGADLAERWTPPEAAALDPRHVDPDGAWYGVATTHHVLQYHTEQIPPAARPTRYEHLTGAHFLGRLAVEEEPLTWLKGLVESWGRQPTVDLLSSLADQGVAVRRGPQTLADLVSAGQYSVAIANRLDAVERDKRGGAKTGWVGIEPVVVQPTVAVLAPRAPHPNAARLFANFLLSADAQVLLATEGRVPARRDVDPEPQGLVRGLATHFTLPPEGAGEQELRALYTDLWRRR